MIDELAHKFGIEVQSQKFDGVYGKGTALGEPCVLLKPQTFMNLSGRSVGAFMRFYKLQEAELIVIHDDVDVPTGKVKARQGGGAGGHNGIRSILQETGFVDFHRLKLGVGKPGPDDVPKDVADWVLAPMRDDELMAYQKSMLDEVLVRLQNIFQATKNK